MPDPRTRADVNGGGPHCAPDADANLNGGKMDGFISRAEKYDRGCGPVNLPVCKASGPVYVMGDVDACEIPIYWKMTLPTNPKTDLHG